MWRLHSYRNLLVYLLDIDTAKKLAGLCHCRLGWIMFVLVHNNFIITTHTASMWLTVVLAMFRYIVVCHPHSVAPRVANLSRTRLAIALVLVTSVILCSPNYAIYRPVSLDDDDGPHPGFWIDYSDHVTQWHKVLNISLPS